MADAPLRTSSYTIFADLPNETNQMLLVHGYTGAYDKVSRSVATYVRSLTTAPPPKPLYGEWVSDPVAPGTQPSAPSEWTLDLLRRRGYLTRMTPQEEFGYVKTIADRLHASEQKSLPQFVIMPTYQCNLRCPYCFQDHMRTDPKYRHLLTYMDVETADRIVDAMPAIEARHGFSGASPPPRQVVFFGGEPLLPECRPVVEHFIRRTTSEGPVSFKAISNATNLEAYEDLLTPDLLSSIQVTFDGPPEEHNKRRVYSDGSGSFDQIARNVSMALDRGVRISARMNVDRNNIDQLPELASSFIEQGWDRYENFVAYAAPIRASNDSTESSTTMSSYDVDRSIDALREDDPSMQVIGRPDDSLKQRVRKILSENGDPVTEYRTHFCGAHSTMYIFDSFADIYACWERTGDQRIRIGQINDANEVEIDELASKVWRKRSVSASPSCSKCRYAFYCGGGCAILAEADHDTMYMNHCDDFQKRFRAMVSEAYLDHVNGVEAKSSIACACES